MLTLEFHWTLLLMTFPLLIRLFLDRQQIKEKRIPDRFLHWIVMIAAIGTMSYFDHKYGGKKYFQSAALSLSLFAFFFDYLINLVKGKNWYCPLDESDLDEYSSFLDEMFYCRVGVWNTLFVKALALGAGIFIYFYAF